MIKIACPSPPASHNIRPVVRERAEKGGEIGWANAVHTAHKQISTHLQSEQCRKTAADQPIAAIRFGSAVPLSIAHCAASKRST
jgi:hypothetical protein